MRYQTTTELTPSQALEQALADFGPDGVGLQITSQTNLGPIFQGGGGHITVTAQLWCRDNDRGGLLRVSRALVWHGICCSVLPSPWITCYQEMAHRFQSWREVTSMVAAA